MDQWPLADPEYGARGLVDTAAPDDDTSCGCGTNHRAAASPRHRRRGRPPALLRRPDRQRDQGAGVPGTRYRRPGSAARHPERHQDVSFVFFTFFCHFGRFFYCKPMEGEKKKICSPGRKNHPVKQLTPKGFQRWG